MATDATASGRSKWVIPGAIAGFIGFGLSVFVLLGQVRWGGLFIGTPIPVPIPIPIPAPVPGPVPLDVSDVSAGMSQGFTRPRPAMRNNWDLKATMSVWNHLVAKGDQSISPPQFREAWYDILVGPSNMADPVNNPASIEGRVGNPFVRIDNGIAYLSGRWIIPRTRRIRGVSPGGTFYGAGVTGDPITDDPVDPASCTVGSDQVIDGRLVIYSDSTKDIVFFAPGANPPTATLVVKNWKTGSLGAGRSEPPFASTDFVCQTITSGNYYVVMYNEDTIKHDVTTVAWSLESGTHEAYAKDVITRVNAAVVGLKHEYIVKRLPLLTP